MPNLLMAPLRGFSMFGKIFHINVIPTGLLEKIFYSIAICRIVSAKKHPFLRFSSGKNIIMHYVTGKSLTAGIFSDNVMIVGHN